jgi:nucleoid-associated protein YgaU
MNKIIMILAIATFAISCAKKDIEPTPEFVEPIEVVENIIVEVEEPTIAITDEAEVEIEIIEEEPVIQLIETEPIQIEIKEPAPNINPDFVLPDSVWVDYMIKPGDYLSLIAYKEYGNANEWKRIYEWNKKRIGDNPHHIYPYHELDLKKPRETAIEWEYEHTSYTVSEGETLWTISKVVYGNEYAWSVLFWDNEKNINANEGLLYPGMILKVRSELWPEF